MALIGNGFSLARNPGTYTGIGAIGVERLAANRYGGVRNWYIGSAAGPGADKHGRPSGAEPPNCWVMPPKGGGLAAFNTLSGSSTLAANLAMGKALAAALDGAGSISAASLSLVTSMEAALAGSGDLTASMRGAVQMVAALAGSGDITAALGLIAFMSSNMEGVGAIVATLRGTASMAADITSAGELLTTANVGAAVWAALATAINNPGTAGALLNGAGSAGDPWLTALPGVYAAGTAGHIIGNRLDVAVSTRAAPGDAMTLDAAQCEAIADVLLLRSLAGGSNGGRTVQQALRAGRNKVAIVGTTLTVYLEDDVTPDWTAEVGTNPRGPLSSIDPA